MSTFASDDRHLAESRDPARESLYESFRWLDEEEDLDLRLFLDDYHANLREELPEPSKHRRPSFRRHLSITKLPFGRSSVSSSRPGTTDAATPLASPLFSPTLPMQPQVAPHAPTRRRSRTLSLIANKHANTDTIGGGIDPSAAHYQDPEARLKLRVYLASPSKFDEAIEFGFPSTDAPYSMPNLDTRARRRQSRQKLSDDSENMRSFLDDGDDDDEDNLSYDGSAPDPDSPKTPQLVPPGHHRPTRVHTEPLQMPDAYAIPASTREMTLRMTLTRPDLRANEEQLYGWQHQPKPQSSDGALQAATYAGQGRPKESIEQALGGMDHTETNDERGVMKRIWNRVRRS